MVLKCFFQGLQTGLNAFPRVSKYGFENAFPRVSRGYLHAFPRVSKMGIHAFPRVSSEVLICFSQGL